MSPISGDSEKLDLYSQHLPKDIATVVFVSGFDKRYQPMVKLISRPFILVSSNDSSYLLECTPTHVLLYLGAVGTGTISINYNVDSKQITGNFQLHFGVLYIILIGDLRQLPPARSTPIYKQPKQTIVGPILWRNLKFYELNEVMRQANQQFSSILPEIGNGEQLDKMEIILIESRFRIVKKAELKCLQDMSLFNTNNPVNKYINKILNANADRVTLTAKDVYIGCTSKEQKRFVRQKFHNMSLIDTNGLPYQTIYVNNIYYIITTNIHVTDGLPNGAVGKLIHVETIDE
ncbi:ATP-dependent DNA helicase [Trichonephila clavipes]|nr:ATP-dependent DNA helicase [Trichonephila clavipes]